MKGYVWQVLLNCGLGVVTGVVVNSSRLGYQSLTACCSLIAAAVTEACITHLSKRLSSTHPFPLKVNTTVSPRTHMLTCSRRRTLTVHMQTAFPLWWQILPVSHGVVCCTSQTPPSSAFRRWIRGAAKGLSAGRLLDATHWKAPLHMITFLKLWGGKGQLSNNRSSG